MCGPHRRSAPLRRIPQAVGTVATLKLVESILKEKSFNTVNSKYYFLITFVLPSLRLDT